LHRIARLALLGLLVLAPGRAAAQTAAADSEAIRQAALDYIEGYYQGDAARMERALHPELAKRIVRSDSTGATWLSTMGASQLIAGTRAGHGREIPPAQQKTDVTILDVYHDVASARIDAGAWIDYLHLARVEGRWVIVNVLWALPPAEAP
jgi:hypothetical protein